MFLQLFLGNSNLCREFIAQPISSHGLPTYFSKEILLYYRFSKYLHPGKGELNKGEAIWPNRTGIIQIILPEMELVQKTPALCNYCNP